MSTNMNDPRRTKILTGARVPTVRVWVAGDAEDSVRFFRWMLEEATNVPFQTAGDSDVWTLYPPREEEAALRAKLRGARWAVEEREEVEVP